MTGPGELHDTDGLVAALRGSPRCSIHHAVNETPAEIIDLLTTSFGGGGDRGGDRRSALPIRPTAFLQTNTAMAEHLYELAVDYAALTGDETVWTLLGGIGTIGLTMARNALTVWGVDISEESVACALENADLNGIANASTTPGMSVRRSRS